MTFSVKEIDWKIAKFYLNGKPNSTKLRRKDVIKFKSADEARKFAQSLEFNKDEEKEFIGALTPNMEYSVDQSFITIGKEIYAYGSLLGEGSFSKVKLGKNRQNHLYAIKIQSDDDCDEPSIREIETDLDLLIAFGHRTNHKKQGKEVSILKYLGVEIGVYLNNLDKQKITVELVLTIYLQCLQQIQDLHSGKKSKSNTKYFHRDIKPLNFVINDESGEIVVNIIDFGFTRPVPKDGIYFSRNLEGTPGYAAPEIFQNYTTIKTEIYALGTSLADFAKGYLRKFPRACPQSTSKFSPLFIILSKSLHTLRTPLI